MMGQFKKKVMSFIWNIKPNVKFCNCYCDWYELKIEKEKKGNGQFASKKKANVKVKTCSPEELIGL